MNVIETYVMDLLHEWYTKMRDQDKEAALEARVIAESNIKSIKRNKTIYIYYCLLLFRSQIFFKETLSDITIEKLQSFSDEMDDYHKFLFHFLWAFMNLTKEGLTIR